jgi:glycosyltransferase involved in cell wall biosynthesis
MSRLGTHEERILMVAPNSSWLPESLIKQLQKDLTGFASPSSWGVDVLREHVTLPVEKIRHGVSSAFSPSPKRRKEAADSYAAKRWNLVHFTSTTMQRKGTMELIRAWPGHVKSIDKFRPTLTIVANAPENYFTSAIREACKDPRIESTIRVIPPVDLDDAEMATFYSHFHGVVQPSRGEGFGLVPLEARACGVPVVMTSCTGHSEHAYERAPGICFVAQGVQLVMTGDQEPIDDGPGATAPALSVENMKLSLDMFYESWEFFSQDALEAAEGVREAWNWENGLATWLAWRNGQQS